MTCLSQPPAYTPTRLRLSDGLADERQPESLSFTAAALPPLIQAESSRVRVAVGKTADDNGRVPSPSPHHVVLKDLTVTPGQRTCLPIILTCLTIASISSAEDVTDSFFDGKTLDNWSLQNGKPVTAGWEVVDGTIHLRKGAGRGGNILSKQEYGNFRLSFEWAIAEGGNSGLKYRVKKFGNRVLGCEYQIYDDAKNKLKPRHTSASLYALYEPKPASLSLLKPTGQFNTAVIVVSGNRIEHWLNGQRVVSAVVGSGEWNSRVADSKFSNSEGFGENRLGRIMLTDHGSEVWYRNIKMESLPPTTSQVAGSGTPRRALRFRNRRRPLRNLFQRLRR